ncbi:hypothetical protein ACH5RR_034299 [Cinchona calisaya]|uniref:Uncharacterized protein n=1 Tax=Cinchona calisaya TaxID=153742 RepID=A0ABD2YBU0_9GENT
MSVQVKNNTCKAAKGCWMLDRMAVPTPWSVFGLVVIRLKWLKPWEFMEPQELQHSIRQKKVEGDANRIVDVWFKKIRDLPNLAAAFHDVNGHVILLDPGSRKVTYKGWPCREE